ncbi:hypothetical protein T439DRAFT_381899 [Meredithblackwellia eburnea MCA 4105]
MRLPVEVWCVIVDKIDSSNQLALISRLSSQLSHVARLSLYDDPLSSLEPDIVTLQQFTTTVSNNNNLAKLVHILPLGHWSATIKKSPQTRRTLSQSNIQILNACTNITTLQFPTVSPLDKQLLLSALNNITTIKNLSFGEGVAERDPWGINIDIDVQQTFGSAHWSFQELASILKNWKNLQKVSFAARLRGPFPWLSPPNQPTLVNDDNAPPPQGLPIKVKEANLILNKHSLLSSNYIIHGLLPLSTHSLRRLSLEETQIGTPQSPSTTHPHSRSSTTNNLLEIIKHFGPSLTHLTTTTKNHRMPSFLLEPIADTCTNLQHLTLGSWVPVQPSTFETLSTLPKLSYLHLAGVRFRTGPRDVGNAIVTAMPAIADVVLGLPFSGETWPDENDEAVNFWSRAAVEGLVSHLRERGVRLVVHDVGG